MCRLLLRSMSISQDELSLCTSQRKAMEWHKYHTRIRKQVQVWQDLCKKKKLTLDTSLLFSIPFSHFFGFVVLFLAVPAWVFCLGQREREQYPRGEAALGYWVLPQSTGRTRQAAHSQPTKADRSHLLSQKHSNRSPSPPSAIAPAYRWGLLMFCDFPGLSFASPSRFARLPAHPPMHAHAPLLVSFRTALSASHNFCSLQFRSLLNETHAGLGNHNVIYNLPQNTFIQLVAHRRKRTPYELAAEALIWLFPHENPSRGACKRGLRGEGKSAAWPQLTLIIDANR